MKGYAPSAKEYIRPNITQEEREQLFSDIVYQYSSLNSSQTNDDFGNNQIKFLINTLLNKSDKKLTVDELIGIMQMNVTDSDYATDRDIEQNKNWAEHIGFLGRKYNQVSHLKLVLQKMNLFSVQNTGKKLKTIDKNGKIKYRSEFLICLTENASEFIPEEGNTKRDTYRFAIMRKAVIEESFRIYGKKSVGCQNRNLKEWLFHIFMNPQRH